MSDEGYSVPKDLMDDAAEVDYYADAPSSGSSETKEQGEPERTETGKPETGEAGNEGDSTEEVETHFPNLGAFVEWLVSAWDHRLGPNDWVWCPQWWKHGEAFSRLSALWRAWEEMRQTPSGLSAWWVDHLDRHMPMLLSPSGPFRHCWESGHEVGMEALRNEETRFRVDPAPADLWVPVERS